MVIFVLFIYMLRFFVSGFLSLYHPMGRDPFHVRVDIDLCIFEACFCHWRKLIWISMLLWWSDILSISHSIGILSLFVGVWGLFLLCIPLLLQVILAMVKGNYSHILCFQYKVVVELHGTHCESSKSLEVLIDRSLVLRLLQFWMVLLVLGWCFCDDSSSNSLCQARLLVLLKLGEVWLFSIGYSCSCQFMSGQCFFSVIDHSFHLYLNGQIFGVGECDWNRDWTIALYQFEWGVNLFSMSLVIVHEFQCA